MHAPNDESLLDYLADTGLRLGLYQGADFIRLPLPERKPILPPFLVEQSITMVCAERGLGKSMLMLGMGLAIAKGEPFLGLCGGSAERVLYIDGEMAPRELQKRLEFLSNGYVPDNLFTVSAPSAFEPWADLNDLYGRMQVDEIIRNVQPKVLILDNKSTLMPPSRENDAESWVDVQRWFIELRKRGLAVVLVHHTGKNGLQRGSSMHEVILDTSIYLRRPSKTAGEDAGARFVFSYEKHRHFYGEEAKPFMVELFDRNGKAMWQVQACKNETLERAQTVRALSEQGLSQRQIADRLGVSVGTINADLRAA